MADVSLFSKIFFKTGTPLFIMFLAIFDGVGLTFETFGPTVWHHFVQVTRTFPSSPTPRSRVEAICDSTEKREEIKNIRSLGDVW